MLRRTLPWALLLLILALALPLATSAVVINLGQVLHLNILAAQTGLQPTDAPSLRSLRPISMIPPAGRWLTGHVAIAQGR